MTDALTIDSLIERLMAIRVMSKLGGDAPCCIYTPNLPYLPITDVATDPSRDTTIVIFDSENLNHRLYGGLSIPRPTPSTPDFTGLDALIELIVTIPSDTDDAGIAEVGRRIGYWPIYKQHHFGRLRLAYMIPDVQSEMDRIRSILDDSKDVTFYKFKAERR